MGWRSQAAAVHCLQSNPCLCLGQTALHLSAESAVQMLSKVNRLILQTQRVSKGGRVP